MEQISQEELNERIAILKRFRSLLEEQKKKFEEYLHVLELQENKIEQEDTDSLLAHSELETEIVANIGSLQKVIVPMQKLYASKASSYNAKDSESITNIQSDLVKLQQQVLMQNEKNRELLKTHMTQLRTQIAQFKNPYKGHISVYAQKAAVGSKIAIEI